jgi:hypothetical protein
MNDVIARLTADMIKQPPVSASDATAIFAEFGVVPPADYLSFLSETNGAEGPVGESSYLTLWRVEEPVTNTSAYQVEEFAPELVLIGSDGGDTAYGLTRGSPTRFIAVPFIGMASDQSEELGRTFQEFLLTLTRR